MIIAPMPSLAIHRYEVFAQKYAETGSSRAAALAIELTPAAAAGILRRPEVHARINEISEQRFNKNGITAQRVMLELARIAFFDPRDMYDAAGNLKPIHELDDDAAAAIAACDVETRMVGRGDDAVPWLVKKIKHVDKMGALSLLAKHFKLVGEDSDGVNALANALSARLNAARKRDFNATRDVVDAEIIGTGRKDYGVEDDPSNPSIVTPPRLELPEADPESINNHSVSAADAVYSRELPMEADDEDLSR